MVHGGHLEGTWRSLGVDRVSTGGHHGVTMGSIARRLAVTWGNSVVTWSYLGLFVGHLGVILGWEEEILILHLFCNGFSIRGNHL